MNNPSLSSAADCSNSSVNRGKETRLACQIDFRSGGVKRDVVYAVQRIPEALIRLSRDYPDATEVEAKMKEVPVTDFY